MLTSEKITTRIAELQGLAKQHEAILLQISGAIQEYQNVLAQASVEKSEVDEPAVEAQSV